MAMNFSVEEDVVFGGIGTKSKPKNCSSTRKMLIKIKKNHCFTSLEMQFLLIFFL